MTGLRWAVLVVIVAWVAWGIRVYRVLTRSKQHPREEYLSTPWIEEQIRNRR